MFLQRLTCLEEQNWVHTKWHLIEISWNPFKAENANLILYMFTFIVLAACGLLKARNVQSARSENQRSGMRAFVTSADTCTSTWKQILTCRYTFDQWRNQAKHFWGAIFARERQGWKGVRGGRGCLPPTVGSFLIYWLENVGHKKTYLRRKFRRLFINQVGLWNWK